MNLTRLALKKKAITYFITLLIVIGGINSFFKLGWLEDPEFTVKTAAIVTSYPGANAEEVELEVTDRIELKLQEMQEIKQIYSESRPGLSIVKVDIKDSVWSKKLPQVWDAMRKKIRDIENTLPPGSAAPLVNDDFGYVFGFLMAVTGDGFNYAQLKEHVDNLRKELSLLKGVARIDLWGEQDEHIYLDVSQTRLAALGLTSEDLQRTLQLQNAVVDAGNLGVQSERLRVVPTGTFSSPQDIGNLVISSGRFNPSGGGELIQIRDIATITRGYVDPPQKLMRLNGKPSIAMALAPISGANVVEVGKAIDARLQELNAEIPIGIEVERISWQGDQVRDSIAAFMINLVEAVAIVLLVLAVTMGVRVGIIIGISGLVLAILATFIIMQSMGIDLHRVSLGALIIAMGMMVDNAIVVVDGFVVKLKQGVERKQAAIEAASVPAWPLLGATIVACMAFYPIYVSPASTGEFAGSLFVVVAISLVVSWVMSQTLTPMMCVAMLPDPKNDGGDVYGGKLYQSFRSLLRTAIKQRMVFILGMVILLVASIIGFGQVKQLFFPDSARQQLMIDYWEPEGTRIKQLSANLKKLEDHLAADEMVSSVSSFIGQGPPRFYLPVSPESNHSSYAQLVVNTTSLEANDKVLNSIRPWIEKNYPGTMIRVRKYPVGSFNDWPFEARFSGPAEADPEVLRDLAAQGMAILEASPYAKEVRTNWLNRVKKLEPVYSQAQGRWAGVSRDDLAQASRRSFDGVPVGQYREGNHLIPIVLRHTPAERRNAATNFEQLQIIPAFSTKTIPLMQVTKEVNVGWEDPVIWRWDRRRAITVQASPEGVTFPAMLKSMQADFEAIKMPPGYRLEWHGEYNSSKESQDGLKPGMLPAVVIMVLIIVVLFNAYRPPLIIFLVIPFAIIGITAGLLMTNTPFGFMAVLGAMSLSGMMIKNAIVLLDQINVNLADGMSAYKSIVEAAVSRLSPVVNAAATTVLGMAPLLQDGFWVSMAVTIMFGLAFGTLLTMIAVPVLYALLYKIRVEE